MANWLLSSAGEGGGGAGELVEAEAEELFVAETVELVDVPGKGPRGRGVAPLGEPVGPPAETVVEELDVAETVVDPELVCPELV